MRKLSYCNTQNESLLIKIYESWLVMLNIIKELKLNSTAGLHLINNKDFSFLDTNLGVFIISSSNTINIVASNDYYTKLKDITFNLDIEDVFEASFISLLFDLLSKDNYLLSGPYLIFTPRENIDFETREYFYVEKSVNNTKELEKYYSFENAVDIQIDQDFYLYVLKKENEVVAISSANRELDSIFSLGIEVSKQHRNKGIGSYLLKYVARDLLANGITPIYLTKTSNINSIKLAFSSNFMPIATTLYTI
jgi:hypothetical protein